MKLSLLFTVFTLASANAVTIQLDNNNLANTNLVTANNGDRLEQGQAVVAIGHFGDNTNAEIVALGSGASFANLFAEFVQVGSSVAFSAVDGFFTGTVEADLTGADSAAVSKGVFIVIGNDGSSLSNADEVLVYRFQDDFSGPPTEGPPTVNLIDGRGSLLIGGFDNAQFDNGAGPTGAFNLVAVPEPSSTALLGLGGLALIIRRRR